MYMYVTQTYKYNYVNYMYNVYRFNPVESNRRDDPAGHKKKTLPYGIWLDGPILTFNL